MTPHDSLTDVAAIVCNHLRERGIDVVVVGGSAVSVHVPDIYTSKDIDLAVVSGFTKRKVARALAEIGFHERGRDFVHPQTPFTIDLVAEIPRIENRPIRDYRLIETPHGRFQTFYLEDAIADRIAAWLHWSDSESLDVASRAARAARDSISLERLEAALSALDASERKTLERMKVARGRLREALGSE